MKTPSVSAVAQRRNLDVMTIDCSRPQSTTPLAANRRADRVARPGAIIPPVLALSQATGDMAAEQPLFSCGDCSPVYSKSS